MANELRSIYCRYHICVTNSHIWITSTVDISTYTRTEWLPHMDVYRTVLFPVWGGYDDQAP